MPFFSRSLPVKAAMLIGTLESDSLRRWALTTISPGALAVSAVWAWAVKGPSARTLADVQSRAVRREKVAGLMFPPNGLWVGLIRRVWRRACVVFRQSGYCRDVPLSLNAKSYEINRCIMQQFVDGPNLVFLPDRATWQRRAIPPFNLHLTLFCAAYVISRLAIISGHSLRCSMQKWRKYAG